MDITKKTLGTLFIIAMLFASPAFAATDTSSNWGGYVVQNGAYTGVSGTFVMPELSYSSSLASNATWVGIGGRTTSDLIQAGVYEIADANGATYQAWYEMLPDDSVPVDLPVHPRDSVSVAILETSTDVWNIVITNNTTKQQFAKTVQYHSLHSSAEWIQERPQVNGTLPPLSGFTPVKFTNAYAVENGQRLTLNQMNPISISLLDTQPNIALAVPSIVGSDNTSFTVFRTSAVASAATPIDSHVPQYLLRRTGHDILPSIPGWNWTILFQPR
ncbi:MAG: hypothetical protein JWL92_659 [Candidatus Nomurabacteria bacterium]|nr:hypothetical protein [Candidatus Nomurabacteria bacterium]